MYEDRIYRVYSKPLRHTVVKELHLYNFCLFRRMPLLPEFSPEADIVTLQKKAL
jgi:hypothetical protein